MTWQIDFLNKVRKVSIEEVEAYSDMERYPLGPKDVAYINAETLQELKIEYDTTHFEILSLLQSLVGYVPTGTKLIHEELDHKVIYFSVKAPDWIEDYYSLNNDLFVIDKASWHYKVANLFTAPSESTNFCEYWRCFFGSIIIGTISTVITLGLLAIVVFSLYDVFFGTRAAGSYIVVLVIWAIGSIIGLGTINEARKERRSYKESKPPGIFTMKYRAVKNKICPGVKFVNNG